jgi:hypothetical protein
MIAAAALLLVASAPPTSPPCRADRAAMLALSEDRFDQDLEGGWRALAAKPECAAAAADLIAAYRTAHPDASAMLKWHEGQLRAEGGQAERAVRLFESSRKAGTAEGWNDYVDATVAFLRRDRKALLAARARLAALPRPADWRPQDAQGRSLPLPWPPNLNVVDGLLRCFDRPYREAYFACAAPIRLTR